MLPAGKCVFPKLSVYVAFGGLNTGFVHILYTILNSHISLLSVL